jgi:hypothetical protein
MKNPLTPAGIEPATFRFVAQHLSHCVAAVPYETRDIGNINDDDFWVLTPCEIWLYASYFLTSDFLKMWTIVVSVWMPVILTEVPSWVYWVPGCRHRKSPSNEVTRTLIRPPFHFITEAYGVTPISRQSRMAVSIRSQHADVLWYWPN